MNDGGAGGAPSLAGYEYQIDVSVWLALDLVLVSQLTEELVLEPTSQEDLEAILEDTEPARLVSQASVHGYTLIVQAKRRGGDAWTPKTLRTLLKHGGEKRPSAAERLKNTKARYLLVTSAGLNGDARKLAKRRAALWPKPAAMPDVIAKGLDHDVSGRVAVIANQDDERLRGDIDRLLTESCRVPNACLAACRTQLHEEARARAMRAGGGRWRRQEIEQVIRKHEGYLTSEPELEHYVHPSNWGDLRAVMAKKSAAIIIGQSGTGKTLATKMLYDELRKETVGLARVRIRLGPAELRGDPTPSPVIYDIEDPWGRVDFDPNSRPWNDQLATFLAAARPDRLIIATSRLDVAKSSGAIDTVKPWIVRLEAENYDTAARQRIYRGKINSVPRELQRLVRNAERQVLDKLATPLEIQKFFDAIRVQDRADLRDSSRFVASAIERAHQNSIEQTVIDQINARNDVPAAAIIWALLAANDKVTRSFMRDIDDGLADIDSANEKGASPLVDFFVAARNLRQADDGIITYYHPRVEAGILRALEEHRQAARRMLRRLIELLVSPDGPGEEWGAGVAARILARARSKLGVKSSDVATRKVDAWLDARLAEGGEDFEDHLDLAAAAGSSASNGAEVARYLLHRPDKSFGAMHRWRVPVHDANWYKAHAEDLSTKPIIDTFIRSILYQDRVDYPEAFADDVTRLASNLAPAFLDAAASAVRHGYLSSDDAIARGALMDVNGFEAIIDTAIEVLTPSEKELTKARKTQLDIVNDVYNEEYAQYLTESDDGYTASKFLKAYVGHVRTKVSWQRILQHRHAGKLRSYWLRAVVEDVRQGRVNDDEFSAAFAAGYGTDDEEHLWIALLLNWNPKYGGLLEQRIREGSSDLSAERAALACILKHDPPAVATIIADLFQRNEANRLVELGRGMVYLWRGLSRAGGKHVAAATEAATFLPQPFRQFYDAEIALLGKRTPVLSPDAVGTLASIAKASDRVRTLRLEIDAHIALSIDDDVRWALEECEESATAVLGIEAAIRRNASLQVKAALKHKFAHVSARALANIAAPLPAPLPQDLLAMSSERGSPVRLALVNVLKAKPHPAHRSTLIRLAGDDWSKAASHYGNDDADYPIAHAAIGALADLVPLDAKENEQLLAIAIDSSDPDVRGGILDLLAKAGGFPLQKTLFELAVQPGNPRIRSSAAFSLLRAADALDGRVIAEITPQLLATRYEPVASVLSLLLGWRGTMKGVRTAAQELATNGKRRVLLLLLILAVRDRDQSVAAEIAAMLPADHAAVARALDSSQAEVEEETIADLGDHEISAEVLRYLNSSSNT